LIGHAEISFQSKSRGARTSAQAVCGFLGAVVSVNDFSLRPPRVLQDGETFTTGKHRFRFISTARAPHGWDAGVMFEETGRTLLCSDLFTHFGAVERRHLPSAPHNHVP
jgi:hypothetical protein